MPEPLRKRRILFVDDEPGIRATLPAILNMHGFEVDSAADVGEALARLQNGKFDVVLSDLNIGEPGDGFTVVSAARRLQPGAVTMIITGFPAFETALQAIRAQVDDYVVKPASVDKLISVIEEKLQSHRRHVPILTKRTAQLLAENLRAIIQEWLADTEHHNKLFPVKLTAEQRKDNLPGVLQEIARSLLGDGRPTAELQAASAEHGRTRRRQSFTVPMLLEEAHLLRNIISSFIHENLLAIDISTILPDLISAEDLLYFYLRESVQAFLEERPPQRRPAKTA